MIFYAPTGTATPAAITDVRSERAATEGTYESPSLVGPPLDDISFETFEGDQTEIVTDAQSVLEEFDWSDAKVNRDFIGLEQKVLARKASSEESKRYRLMKRDRASVILADKYMRDYSEVQRLKKLSEKLAEVQKYIRPIMF